jgi:membrane protein
MYVSSEQSSHIPERTRMAGDSSGDSDLGESPTTTAEEPQSRWKQTLAGLRDRFDVVTAAAEERRDSSRTIDVGFRVLERNRNFPASLLVGALASRIVIFVIPALALVVFSFGLYADTTSTGDSEPGESQGMAALFARAAQDSESMDQGLRFAAVVAITYAALYAANGLGRLVRRSTALIWAVPYERARPAWVLPLAVVAGSGAAWALITLGRLVDDSNWRVFALTVLAELAALVLLWLLVSRHLPHDPRAGSWFDFLPGALFVGFGVVAMRVAMVVYLAPASAGLYERYGSIGIALIMLTWAYWLGLIVVGSAELNAAVFRSRLGGSES